MAARRNVPYSALPTEDRDEDNVDRRFTYTPKSLRKIPWKSIALALFLLFLGSSLLFLSYFISTGHMEGDSSQAYGLLFLGILAFLPGDVRESAIQQSWKNGGRCEGFPPVLQRLSTRAPLPSNPLLPFASYRHETRVWFRSVPLPLRPSTAVTTSSLLPPPPASTLHCSRRAPAHHRTSSLLPCSRRQPATSTPTTLPPTPSPLARCQGFYETRVAYYSWRGAPGYTFASIPDY